MTFSSARWLRSSALLAAMGLAVACGDSDDPGGGNGGNGGNGGSGGGNGGSGNAGSGNAGSGGDADGGTMMPPVPEHPSVDCDEEGSDLVCTINGDSDDPVVEDLTLTSDITWILGGPVFIGDDEEETVLTVEAGTEVLGSDGTFIVIQRGSKIMAEGTPDDPIVFTSVGDSEGNKATGDWGGLVINGRAPTNLGENVVGEAGSGTYGGDDPNDDSGVLKYVRVEYAGNLVDASNELNGIAFQGVGDATEVDYIQVHFNADDGVEFFGGTVNAKHLVLTGAGDDSLDWTNGWTGSVQYVFIQQDESGGERGIEADNQEEDFTAEPFSNPTLSNFTMVGVGSADVGAKLRRGTRGSLFNSVITGFPGGCLSIDDPDDTAVEFTNLVIACDTPFAEADGSTATEDTFDDGDGNVSMDADELGLDENWLPEDGSPVLGIGDGPSGDFFDEVDFAGAFDQGDDWREGWTTLSSTEPPEPPMAPEHPSVDCTTDDEIVCTITGDSDDPVVEDLTLTPGITWILGGPVFIGDDEEETVLTLEAGTTVLGSDGTFLVIQRGSKIMAEGTAAEPIVLTSVGDSQGNRATGDWGGLVINGRAPTNLGENVVGEAGSGTYGGDDPNDDSGVLKYVRVEFAGNLVDASNELNGIAFQGVGDATEVDYIQVHFNADDGVEFFGGTVNAKHLVLTGAGDDSLDWTNGWTGSVQHVFIQQDESGGERGIEADNQEEDFTAEPFSDPTLSNFTMVGAAAADVGVKLRRGTRGALYNSLITGFPGGCLSIDDPADTEVTFTNLVLACDTSFSEAENSTETEDTFDAGDGNSVVDAGDLGVDEAWLPEEGSPLLGVGDGPDGDFFDATDYAGAFDEGEDWREGWTTDAAE